MTFKKQIGLFLILGIIITGLIGCTSETSNLTPNEVIKHVLEEQKEVEAYSAEGESTSTISGEDSEEMVMREWRSEAGEIRIEMKNKDGSDQTIAVNDGEKLITYQVDENQAFIIGDPEILGFNQPSAQEQATFLLNLIRETHDITIEGEEKIAGRNTYHLVAKVTEDNSLFGDQEMWIDKEHWLVLKSTLTIGDTKSEAVYTKIDFGVKAEPEMFTLDLPEGTAIQELEDMSDIREVTLEEAVNDIGQQMLYFQEESGIEMKEIKLTELEGEVLHKEVSIDYEKENLPLLTLAIFETHVEAEDEESIFPGEEEIEIRGQTGSFTDLDGFRSLIWEEDGLTYSVMLIDQDLTLEVLKEMTEEMQIMK